jgi:hypothetical protein
MKMEDVLHTLSEAMKELKEINKKLDEMLRGDNADEQ